MSRAHFVAVAALIKEGREQATQPEAVAALDTLARALCIEYKRANSAFKRETFLRACGIDD